MDDQPGLSDQYGKSSPWPLFVAGGLVLSELGVLFGYGSVAVGGLLLFAASTVGILRESGFASTLSRSAFVIGALFAAFGGLVLQFTDAQSRGSYILVSGVLVVVAAVVLWLVENEYL